MTSHSSRSTGKHRAPVGRPPLKPSRRLTSKRSNAPVVATGAAMAAAIACVSLVGGASAATMTNRLYNPGFELGTTGWAATGSAAAQLATVSGGHSGASSARLTTGKTETTVLNDASPNSIFSQAGVGVQGTTWVRTRTPGLTVQFRVAERQNGKTIGRGLSKLKLSDTAWHQMTLKYVPATTGAKLDVNVLVYRLTTSQSFDVDDVALLTPESTPTTSVSSSAPATTTTSPATTSPTPTPTASPSVSASPSPTATPTATASSTPTASPTSSPTSSSYPRVASVEQKTGETWADACVRTMTYGYNGCVRYLPAGRLPAWDAAFQSLADKVGDKPVSIQLTAKTHDNAGLADVLSHLPAAWKPLFIYNIFQEPEDNLLDAASQAAYRQAYTDAATVTRRYGVSLPWVEWQQWTVDPYNTKGWNLANFTPPASDFGGVLWSLYEYNERDHLDQQVATITSAMSKYAPGKPWGLMASGYTLEGAPYADAQLSAQAAWMSKSYRLTREAGSRDWGWFNLLWPGTGGAGGESRVELNPDAQSWLQSL